MRSSGRSSSSPAICRMAMRLPVPMSTLPTKTVTELSACTARYESTTSGASGFPRKRSAPATVWAAPPRAPKLTTRAPLPARKARRERSTSASSPGGSEHGADHAGVAAAAAEVAGQRLAHLLLGRTRRAVEQRPRAHHHPRRAVAALRGLLGDERRLKRIGTGRRAETLDGDHVLTGERAGRRRAGAEGATIHQHGAGAALAEPAAQARAGQPEVVAQDVQQRHVRVIRLHL